MPSRIDSEHMGGRRGLRGYSVQVNYAITHLAHWLQEPGFRAVRLEGRDDVEVSYSVQGGVVRDLHQLKHRNLSLAEFRTLVKRAKKKTDAEGEKKVRRNVLAVRHPPSAATSLFESLDQYRYFDHEDDEDSRRETVAALRSRLKKVGLGSETNFVINRVRLTSEFGSESAPARYAAAGAALAQVKGFDTYFDSERAIIVKNLAGEMRERPDTLWTREELVRFAATTVRQLRDGVAPSGSPVLIAVKHVALKPANDVERADLKGLLGKRALRRLDLGRVNAIDPTLLADDIRALCDLSGPYLAALRAPSTTLLYYGFPFVPLGVLAGFLAGRASLVHVVDEHEGRFRWPDDPAPAPAIEPSCMKTSTGTAAVVRISLSSTVREDICRAVVAPEDTRVDLHLTVPVPARGIVQSEQQARDYAKEIAKAIDSVVAGDPNVTSIHIFAAVPVSVGFLLGQRLDFTGLPAPRVYSLASNATSPRYCWGISLRDAKAARDSFLVLRPTEGEA